MDFFLLDPLRQEWDNLITHTEVVENGDFSSRDQVSTQRARGEVADFASFSETRETLRVGIFLWLGSKHISAAEHRNPAHLFRAPTSKPMVQVPVPIAIGRSLALQLSLRCTGGPLGPQLPLCLPDRSGVCIGPPRLQGQRLPVRHHEECGAPQCPHQQHYPYPALPLDVALPHK